MFGGGWSLLAPLSRSAVCLGGPSPTLPLELPQALQDKFPVLEPPLERLVLLDMQGLGERAGDGDRGPTVGDLLDFYGLRDAL